MFTVDVNAWFFKEGDRERQTLCPVTNGYYLLPEERFQVGLRGPATRPGSASESSSYLLAQRGGGVALRPSPSIVRRAKNPLLYAHDDIGAP